MSWLKGHQSVDVMQFDATSEACLREMLRKNSRYGVTDNILKNAAKKLYTSESKKGFN